MPIIDSEPYSRDNTEYILSVLAHLLEEEGRDFANENVFYFNLFFGKKFFSFGDSKHRSHVCRKMPFGLMFVIFHLVARGDVVRCASDHISCELDSCISILWTADELSADQIDSGLLFADEVVRNIEHATGRPCPIPLSRSQVSKVFELAHFSPGKGVVTKILVRDENEDAPKIDADLAPKLYALSGFDDRFNELMQRKPHSAISLAARWQQKAIRAAGNHEWADCIISSSVWVEVFVVQITVGINESIGDPIPDVRRSVARGLPQFINAHLGSKHLKGRWDHTDQETIFGKWYQRCYDLRNSIVHLGKLPSAEEAVQAYSAAHDFVQLLTVKIGGLDDPRLIEFTSLLRHMSPAEAAPS